MEQSCVHIPKKYRFFYNASITLICILTFLKAMTSKILVTSTTSPASNENNANTIKPLRTKQNNNSIVIKKYILKRSNLLCLFPTYTNSYDMK